MTSRFETRARSIADERIDTAKYPLSIACL